MADANTGWLMHDAARVVRAVADVDVYIEQPCLSFEECLAIRRRTDHPFVLDETIDSVDVLLRAHAEGAMDVINLKISKVGGLTKARQIRDLCVCLGIAMTIEDSWGGDITTAAIAHLAHSTPEALRFSATDFNSYVTRQHGRRRAPAPARPHGRLHRAGARDEAADARARGKPVLEVTPALASGAETSLEARLNPTIEGRRTRSPGPHRRPAVARLRPPCARTPRSAASRARRRGRRRPPASAGSRGAATSR